MFMVPTKKWVENNSYSFKYNIGSALLTFQ